VKLAYQAAVLELSDDPAVAAQDKYQQATANRVARLQKDNPSPVTNVGYGNGIAMQFTHSFAAIVRVSVPNFDSMSASDKASGYVTIDATGPYGGPLGNLAQCSFAGVCSAMEGLSVTPGANAIVLSGVFPQKLSWTPAGAYLTATVHMPDGSTTYSGSGDIPFAGARWDCLSAHGWKYPTDKEKPSECQDQEAAEKFYTSWVSTGALPWPTVFNADFDYPRDTPLLSGPLP
jgi:hypothetical protein